MLKLRGDGLANLEQTLALRATAAKVGGVPGEPIAGVDVEGDFGVRVSGEVHCGVSVQKIELTVWSAVRLLLPLTSPTQALMRCQSRAAVPCKLLLGCSAAQVFMAEKQFRKNLYEAIGTHSATPGRAVTQKFGGFTDDLTKIHT